jgi:hypothetical protein
MGMAAITDSIMSMVRRDGGDAMVAIINAQGFWLQVPGIKCSEDLLQP